MTPAQIEQLAIVMKQLDDMGFSRQQIKKAADAWWRLKGMK